MAFDISGLSTTEQITALYVGYFGRSPDPIGLTVWRDQLEESLNGDADGDPGRSLEEIGTLFSTSKESQNEYQYFEDLANGVVPNEEDAATFINEIYNNLFGRDAEEGGLLNWTNHLVNGTFTAGEIIITIMEGAGPVDQTRLENRIDVALDFHDEAVANDVPNFPEGSEAKELSKTILDGVDETDASVEAAKQSTDVFFAGDLNEGDTFVLSENIDVPELTSDNDTIIGARDGGASTFTLGDQIDGAGGTDTLRIVSNETDLDLSLADLTSVENLSLRASADIGDVNLDGNAFEAVSIDGQDKVQTGDTFIGDIAADSEITIEDVDFNDENLEIRVAEQAGPVNVTVTLRNVDDAAAFGSGEATLALDASGDGSSNDDTVNLFLDGVKNTDGDMEFYTTDAETFNVTVVSDSELENIGNYYNEDGSDFGPTVVNLVADADLMISNFWDLTDTADVTTTFNITGAGNVSIAQFDDGDSDVTVDGSAATGDLELLGVYDNFLAVTTGTGNDTVEIEDAATVVALGEGDDKAIVDTNLTTADSDLDGGAGDADVLSVANSIAASGDDFSDNIAGFERLEIGKVAEGFNDVVDVTNFDDVDYVISNGTEAGTAVAEQQIFDFDGTGVFGGRVTIEGVQIDLPANLSAGQVAQFIVDNHAEDIKTAYLANNPGEVMESVQRVNFDQIEFDFAQLSGDVPLVDIVPDTGPLSAGAAFGPGSPNTPGTDPVNEVQTIEITTAPTTNGTVRFEVDADTGPGFLVDVDVFQGETTLETADRVATAIDAAIPPQFGTVTLSGSSIQIEYDAQLPGGANAFNGDFTDTDGTGTTVTWTEDTIGVTPAVETQTFEITSGTDVDGGFVQIALPGSGTVDLKVDPNLTVDELGFAILAQTSDIIAAIPELASVNFDSGTNELTFTSTLAAGDIPLLSVGNTPGNFPDVFNELEVVPATTIPGVDGSLSGSLTLDEVASGGTLELTDALVLDGDATVNVTDAGLTGSTDDRFNIKLNGTQQIANTGMLNIAAVETINIETANSDEDLLPTAASDLNLQTADAETVTVAGNHGVDFAGSDLSSMTLLDASGVQATESSAGADDAGVVGAVTISTGATDADVTILTGNGDDFINAGFVGTDPDDTGSAATIEAGAGNDLVFGSQGDDSIDMGEGADFVQSSGGADTITLGAGNDTYFLADEGDSVINSRDVITDFSANTVGQGPDGAVDEFGAIGPVDDRDGDVIDLSIAGAASLSVEVFANASDATTFLANNDADGEMNIALDSSTGFLYIDTADDGIANSVIELTGVTTIDEAAFII